MFTRFANKALVAAASVAATVASMGFAVPAQAAPADTATVVRYGDLDLATAAGTAQLQRRLRWAAASVCGGPELPRPLDLRSAVLKCRGDAMAAAQPQVEVAMAKASNGQSYADAGIGVTAGR